MPELAEVYFHASKWKAHLGERFSLERANVSTRCGRAFDLSLAGSALSDARLEQALTHGKRMLFLFSEAYSLELHLGMTGALRVEPIGYEPEKHDHLILKGERFCLVFNDPRQFGKFVGYRCQGIPDWWLALPPQPQDPAFSISQFKEWCSRRKGAVLKAFLLQQEVFPGVGNWMADEILWRARVRPQRKVGSLNEGELQALYEQVVWVCKESIRIIGSDYSDPPEGWLFNVRWKDGGICPATGKPLLREAVGGRTTCWSPAWQR